LGGGFGGGLRVGAGSCGVGSGPDACGPPELAPLLTQDDEVEGADALDNCLEEANRNQLDTNSDGIGNQCDADFDNNGVVGGGDFIMLSNAWGATPGDAAYDPDIDMDDNDADRGVIGGSEFIWLSNQWGRDYSEDPQPGLPGCNGTTSPCP